MRFVLLLLLLLASCTQYPEQQLPLGHERTQEEPQNVSVILMLSVTSPVFKHNGAIPAKYTCQGQDISPPLEIQGVPATAQSIILILDDPDAPVGVWTHWVVWNIPATTTMLLEGKAPAGSVEGMNSWQKQGYGGPCPPSGTHRYVFKLYVLDAMLNLPSSADKRDVEQATQGHIIVQTQLIGLYKKS